MTAHELASIAGARERGPGKFEGPCPSHGGRSGRSLVVSQAEDRILVHCRAGCRIEDVCGALGLTVRDLFDDSRRRPPDAAAEQEAQAWEGLECWRQRWLKDCCAAIRGLDRFAFDVGQYLANHGATLADPGRLQPNEHAQAVDALGMCYAELPVLDREWELLNSPHRSDHLAAWRQAKRRRTHATA